MWLLKLKITPNNHKTIATKLILNHPIHFQFQTNNPFSLIKPTIHFKRNSLSMINNLTQANQNKSFQFQCYQIISPPLKIQ